MIPMVISLLLTFMMMLGAGISGGDESDSSPFLNSEENGKIRGALAGLYLTINRMEGCFNELPGSYWDDKRSVMVAYTPHISRMTVVQLKRMERVIKCMEVLEKTSRENLSAMRSNLRMDLILAMKEFE